MNTPIEFPKQGIIDDFTSLYNKIVKNGIYNSSTFSQKEREYIFAYISKKNNNNTCFNDHINRAIELGYTDANPVDPAIIEFVDKLIDNSLYIDSSIDTILQLQLSYLVFYATFVNRTKKITHRILQK
jgi:hypothetical protein